MTRSTKLMRIGLSSRNNRTERKKTADLSQNPEGLGKQKNYRFESYQEEHADIYLNAKNYRKQYLIV